MSWDLYCYQSASNSPDSEEADALINTDEPDPDTAWPRELKNQVAQALITFTRASNASSLRARTRTNQTQSN